GSARRRASGRGGRATAASRPRRASPAARRLSGATAYGEVVTSRTRLALAGLVVIASLATATSAYEVLVGFPRRVEGRWVRRATTWYAYDLTLPIPYMRGEMSWYYTAPDGRRVPHGSRVYRHRNGRAAHLQEYRDGRLTGIATSWNERGVKT